jgi:hypothetical protein
MMQLVSAGSRAIGLKTRMVTVLTALALLVGGMVAASWALKHIPSS